MINNQLKVCHLSECHFSIYCKVKRIGDTCGIVLLLILFRMEFTWLNEKMKKWQRNRRRWWGRRTSDMWKWSGCQRWRYGLFFLNICFISLKDSSHKMKICYYLADPQAIQDEGDFFFFYSVENLNRFLTQTVTLVTINDYHPFVNTTCKNKQNCFQ